MQSKLVLSLFGWWIGALSLLQALPVPSLLAQPKAASASTPPKKYSVATRRVAAKNPSSPVKKLGNAACTKAVARQSMGNRWIPLRPVSGFSPFSKTSMKGKVPLVLHQKKGMTMLADGPRYTLLSHFAKQNGLKYVCKGTQVQLSNEKHRLVFTVGTKEATLDGVKVFLSFPVDLQQASVSGFRKIARRLQWIAPEYRIRTVDAQYVIKPILSSQGLGQKIAKKIVIDPGHGGKADGTVQNGLKEKTLTLRTARLLAEKLRRMGYLVELTRTTDVDVSLTQRSDFANVHHADLFVSIHYNSAPSPKACGIETYAYPIEGTPPTHQVLPKDQTVADINRFNAQNAQLAWSVQKQIVSILKPVDRGVKRMYLGVLKNLKRPGILIECGFLSNPNEAKACMHSAYQEKLTRAIAEGIRAYSR